MNVINFNERSCEKYRRFFDAYLDNELLVETNHDLLQHLASCPDCTRMIEDRGRVKQLVRNTVKREEAPAALAASIQARLRPERRSFFGIESSRWMMAAAAVVVFVIAAIATRPWRISLPVATISARVQEIIRVGLLDHVHCAILSQQWKRLLSLDQMKAETGETALGPQFIELVPAVQAALGTNFKLVQGHRCTVDGRKYIHFILTGDKETILSLVITEKQNESFIDADAAAVIQASGIPIYRDRQDNLEIAAFESSKYLAYIVSNLEQGSNLDVASALAPVVYSHLRRIEL